MNQKDNILVYITQSNIMINIILRQVAPPTLYPITLSILIVLSSNSHSLFRIYKYTTKKNYGCEILSYIDVASLSLPMNSDNFEHV